MIYCKECKYVDWDGSLSCICTHPDNLSKGNWFSKDYKRTPKTINEKNDCVWFVEKEKK